MGGHAPTLNRPIGFVIDSEGAVLVAGELSDEAPLVTLSTGLQLAPEAHRSSPDLGLTVLQLPGSGHACVELERALQALESELPSSLVEAWLAREPEPEPEPEPPPEPPPEPEPDLATLVIKARKRTPIYQVLSKSSGWSAYGGPVSTTTVKRLCSAPCTVELPPGEVTLRGGEELRLPEESFRLRAGTTVLRVEPNEKGPSYRANALWITGLSVAGGGALGTLATLTEDELGPGYTGLGVGVMAAGATLFVVGVRKRKALGRGEWTVVSRP